MSEEEIETMLEPFMPFALSHYTYKYPHGKKVYHRYGIEVDGTDLDRDIEKETFELLKPYASRVFEEGKLV